MPVRALQVAWRHDREIFRVDEMEECSKGRGKRKIWHEQQANT